jgi:SAM-dependent methyltransferase
MITLHNCPVCNSTEFKLFLKGKDHFLTKEEFSLVECLDCGLKFTNPRPNDLDLGRYYQSQEYISHTNNSKGLIPKLYQLVRNYTLYSKEKLIRSYVSRGTLLDYGCGSGHFMTFCQANNWAVSGVEPDDGARSIAKTSVRDVFKTKEELMRVEPQKQFSAISLWHVLEHLPDLNSVVDFLRLSLEKDGTLFIALPNPNSYDAKKYKEHWAAFDLPRHLYHFNKASIVKLMSNFGFVLRETRPMYFDSFYVSLLSEKYLHGKARLFPAVLTGLTSNMKALKNKEYSSLIYIFQKE